jgi:hypothetical protein
VEIMKKLISSVALPLVLLIGIAPPLAAQNGWVRLLTDDDNEVWYINPGSIQRNGPIRFFWVFRDAAGSRPIFSERGRNVYGMTAYLSADCRSGVMRIRAAEFFDENSNLVTKSEPGDRGPSGKAFSGHPVAQAVARYVCGQ